MPVLFKFSTITSILAFVPFIFQLPPTNNLRWLAIFNLFLLQQKFYTKISVLGLRRGQGRAETPVTELELNVSFESAMIISVVGL